MKQPDEHLDRLTRLVARAGGLSDGEAEDIASSPFLHARVRARIEAERERHTKPRGDWFATLLVASRAIAVMLVVTIAAALSFWFSRAHAPAGTPVANAGADNLSRVVTGGTCALSATDECAISSDEVLATMFASEGGTK